jgi:hypothetical protein
MGSMLLMGNTATIDTGKMKDKWHTNCASRFFIFTLIAQALNTGFCWFFHLKTKALSLNNLYFKTGLIVLLIMQILLSSVYGAIGLFGE